MKRLTKIYLEITNVCNLSCPFCPAHSRLPSLMSESDFGSIISKIAGKADILYFHLKGEPTLHPSLGSFMTIAGEAGFKIHLTTNGTLLEKAQPVLEGNPALARLNLSLQSLPQLPATERRRLSNESLAACLALADRNAVISPDFLISLRLWTKDSTDATAEALGWIADYFDLDPDEITRTLAHKNGMKIRPGIALHTAETFEWPSLAGHEYGSDGFCHALRDQAGILVDGTVVPCCLDGEGIVNLGNILESDWDTIMNGPRATALYAGFSGRKAVEPLCRHCGFRTRFDGRKDQRSL